MAEFIECRDCDSRSCAGCNTYILSQMLHAGKLDGIMDEHHTILAADVEPVVHGRWEAQKYWKYENKHSIQYHTNRCSLCHCDVSSRLLYNYCPNCGARMDGE